VVEGTVKLEVMEVVGELLNMAEITDKLGMEQ